MTSLRSFAALLALCIMASGCSSLFKRNTGPELSGRIAGSVTYRERIALPPDTKVIISLEDVTRANRTGGFVAQQTLQPKTQVPIPFDLRYLPQSIDRSHRYAISAAILDNREEILWTSESIPVLFNEQDKPVTIVLERAINPNTAIPPPVKTTTIPFKCDEVSLIARFGANSVEVLLPGRTIKLPQVVSGSGARYTDGSTTFWNKGDTALFEMNGVSYKGCRADPLTPLSEPSK
jgi:putative lipoprotein